MTGATELARLLRRAGDSDVGAFARVYDATASRAYGTCLRILDDPAEADAAMDRAYREVWTRASSYDPARGSAVAWVLAIAHRVAVDRAQEAGVVRGSTVAVRSVVAGAVDAVLAQLDTLEWAAVELAYFGGRRHGEVAGMLGLSPVVALDRIRDGLVRVRDLTAAG